MLKEMSKKLSLAFVMTLLLVAMLPVTVFAKEKLPSPTSAEWGVDYYAAGHPVGENDDFNEVYISMNPEIDSVLYSMRENIQAVYTLYEDGIEIDTVVTETFWSQPLDKYLVASRDYQNHEYTYSVVFKDITGQYEDSDIVYSSAIDTKAITQWKETEIARNAAREEAYQNNGSATVYYDANGGITGENWTTSALGLIIGYDTFGGWDVTEEIWASYNESGDYCLAPDGMKFAGLEINGVFYASGETVPEFVVSGDYTLKWIWAYPDGTIPTPAVNTGSASDAPEMDGLWGKLDEALAKGGSQTVTINGSFSLTYDVLVWLQNNPKVTLIYNVSYDGKTTTCKLNGKKVKADPNVYWYGPGNIAATYGTGTVSTGTTAAAGNGTYTIQSGDCLWKIARNLGVSVQHLVSANNIEDPDMIFAGKVLNY